MRGPQSDDIVFVWLPNFSNIVLLINSDPMSVSIFKFKFCSIIVGVPTKLQNVMSHEFDLSYTQNFFNLRSHFIAIRYNQDKTYKRMS